MEKDKLKEQIRRLVDEAGAVAPSISFFEQDKKYGRVTDEAFDYDAFISWKMEAKAILIQLSNSTSNIFSDLYKEYQTIEEDSKKWHSKSILVHKIQQLLVGAYTLIESPLSQTSFSISENSGRENSIKEKSLNTQKPTVFPTNKQSGAKKDYWENIRKDFDVSKRTFGKKISFIGDQFIRQVIFRDVEHAYTLCKSGYYKPSVLLSGGVIEELLRQYLQFKNFKPQKDTFDEYIKACEQYGLLKSAIRQLSDSVRQFRNLVHIVKEKSPKYTISRATAWGAVSIIFTISNDF